MITSESNAQMKELVKLQKSAKERKKKKCFVVEGSKLLEEAFSEEKLRKFYLSETVSEHEKAWVKKIAKEVPFEVVSDSVLKAVSDTVTPQGVLGVVQMPEYLPEELFRQKKKHFLILDDLRDPGNLGTIMRTAEGAGMNAVFLSKNSVDMFNPKVVRSTMGSVFRVPFCYVENLPELIDRMKKQIPVYGCVMEGNLRYDEPGFKSGAGVVIGNEANGISEEVKKHLSETIRIPMAGKLESLNAAVAAAILMYEMARGEE